MKLFFTFLVTAGLAACASSGGVLKLGPDTYMVSSQVLFGPGKATSARAAALIEADKFCTSQGKEVLVDSFSTTGHAMSITGDSEVRFKCLRAGDTDLQRPKFESQPNLVIETRQR
jgi:hypothetical protein